MTKLTAEQLRAMSGERLRDEARRADRAMGVELERIRLADAEFRAAIDYALRVEDEQLRRRK